jgi:hypothetical protein
VKKYGLILFVVLIAALAKAELPCSPLTPPNVFIAWSGPVTGCNTQSGVCASAEPVTFAAQSFGYNFSCATHTFDWDFGDGTPHLHTRSVTHQYANPGTYPVSLLISNGVVQLTVHDNVVVGPTVPTFSPLTFALLGVCLCAAAWLTLRR